MNFAAIDESLKQTQDSLALLLKCMERSNCGSVESVGKCMYKMNFESGVPNPWRAEARAKFLASLETLKAKTIDEGVAGIGDIESPSYGLSAGADPVQAIDQAIQKLHQETQQTSRKAQSILRELERTDM